MGRRAAIVGALLLAGAIAIPVLSDSGWREIAGWRVVDGDRVDFVLRYRATEALLVESRGGVSERTVSCSGRAFVESYGDPVHTITRETSSDQQCFEMATGSLMGFGRLAVIAATSSAGVVVGDRRGTRLTGFPPAVGWSEVVLDDATQLPLRAVDPDGTAVEWHYDRIDGVPGESVRLPDAPAHPDEFYRTLSGAEAAAGAGLSSDPPDTIGDLRFEAAFAYRGGLLTELRYYVVWRNARGDEVQLVVSPGELPADTPVVEDLGGGAFAFNKQDRNVHWQIFASDKALLHAAVAALRPEDLPELP